MKKVKFKLPVDALFGGLRHLGNGEFVGYLDDPQKPHGLQQVPHIIEGRTISQDDGNWSYKGYELTLFDDPHDAVETKYVRITSARRPEGFPDCATGAA